MKIKVLRTSEYTATFEADLTVLAANNTDVDSALEILQRDPLATPAERKSALEELSRKLGDMVEFGPDRLDWEPEGSDEYDIMEIENGE